MSLPDLIEIVPLQKPVRAEIRVPGSKSITNRVLILAALADGETRLKGALWSEDTQIMVGALKTLGFTIKVERDPIEFCNRTITVVGMGGRVPKGGKTGDDATEIFVGNAGTAARFLAAFVCLGKGYYKLSGVPRMHERPQYALFKAISKPSDLARFFSLFSSRPLAALGYSVQSKNGKLPVTILGSGRRVGAKCDVSIEESSQFASALLLCEEAGGWKINVLGDNAEESPYVAMTTKLIELFRKNKGETFQIEPDASSGSYFWAAGWLFPVPKNSPEQKAIGVSRFDLSLYLRGKITRRNFFSVSVLNWPMTDWQIDQWFPALLSEPPDFPGTTSRISDMGDSIMTAITVAPFAHQPCKFTDLGRLRVQETERVVALRTELTRCGARVVEERDTLTVYPSQLHGAEIETYGDHRMAMCFATLGLKVPGIKIKNPACVKKTFPNFFQKLAAAPPHGLGATILEGKTGRRLTHDELFAD
ncbi:MAG: 3-phosphoshikimate 1-carboxyvinyltransferase [Verrucomicrobiales bacterium]|nr:3-phosphoshikimate 1-carboxyvinyltransferase [Verrucomicrobiales bacterium]